MESAAYIVFSIILYMVYVSIGAKIIYFLFFTDRFVRGEITEKQSPELAGKKYILYSQIFCVTKGIICENSDVEEFFRAKNNKIISPETFGQISQNKTRLILARIFWILSMIVNVLKMIGMFILNILKTILPVLGKMTGMDAATVNRQRRHAYNELLFHHPDSLSEYDKQWLNM